MKNHRIVIYYKTILEEYNCSIAKYINERILKMAVPKRKTSKMKKRLRKAANRYEGVQATFCPNCKAPCFPHQVCPNCGMYKGKQVITVEA